MKRSITLSMFSLLNKNVVKCAHTCHIPQAIQYSPDLFRAIGHPHLKMFRVITCKPKTCRQQTSRRSIGTVYPQQTAI